MSSINLIMDALMADIPPNIQQDRGEQIWDARHKLELVLLEKLSGQPDAQTMLDRYREQPDVYGSVLEQALINADAHEDPAVTEAAGEVLAVVDPLDADTESDDVMNVPGTYGTGDADTGHE